MSEAWIVANSIHPDDGKEYDVIFADNVAKLLQYKKDRIVQLETERDELKVQVKELKAALKENDSEES